LIISGIALLFLSPNPNCPDSFNPHDYRFPLLSIANEWSPAPAIVEILILLSFQLIISGIALLFLSPNPNCTYLL
jgi:hypothetical protein